MAAARVQQGSATSRKLHSCLICGLLRRGLDLRGLAAGGGGAALSARTPAAAAGNSIVRPACRCASLCPHPFDSKLTKKTHFLSQELPVEAVEGKDGATVAVAAAATTVAAAGAVGLSKRVRSLTNLKGWGKSKGKGQDEMDKESLVRGPGGVNGAVACTRWL